MEKDQDDFHERRHIWRKNARPHCDKTTRKQAGKTLKTKVKKASEKKFQTNTKGKENPMLTRTRYVCYMKHWEDQSRELSEKQFDEKHKLNPEYNSDDESVVEAKGNSYRKKEKGYTSKRGTSESHRIAWGSAQCCRALGVGEAPAHFYEFSVGAKFPALASHPHSAHAFPTLCFRFGRTRREKGVGGSG